MRIFSGIIITLIHIIPLCCFGQPNSSIDFFKVPKDAKVSYSQGALRGTHHSKDSIGYIGMADVYCGKNTYELLFLYKDVVTRNTMSYDDFSAMFFNKELGKDLYTDFECYAFVYPQHDPEQMADAHALTIDFPVTVTAYKKTGKKTWQYVSKITANTFEDFSEFQFRVIYHLIPGDK